MSGLIGAVKQSRASGAAESLSGARLPMWSMMIRRLRDLLRPFRQLRWKLTLSHTLVTVAALLTVEIIVIAGGIYYFKSNAEVSPGELFSELETYYLPIAQFYLADPSRDMDGLTLSLGQMPRAMSSKSRPIVILGNIEIDMTSYDVLEVYFIRADGTLVNKVPRDSVAPGTIGRKFDVAEIPGLEEPLTAALGGEHDYRRLYTVRLPEYRVVGAMPVFASNRDQRLLGALAFTTKSLAGELWPLEGLLPGVGISLLFFTVFAGAAGTIFGSLTARGLVYRLRQMSESTHAWSKGDFAAYVEDPNGDELGELARELNEMAQRLEHLLDRRQELSIMEERNRLARDLHDSAKQQAFAASAQLGAARALWHQDPDAAETHLHEAELLVDQVRQELTHLIQELRPPAFKGAGLGTVLRDYALDWGDQSGIRVSTHIHCDRDLAAEVEQTLFRIAQEALANVARHSQARHVELVLEYGPSSVVLAISDDGRGFDPQNQVAGLGLRSMRERAEMLSGELTVSSRPGNGTCVSVTCPA
jgi:NarL family two-component system sensor histidine kinase LiaS